MGDCKASLTGGFLEQTSVGGDISIVEFALELGDGKNGLLRSLPGL